MCWHWICVFLLFLSVPHSYTVFTTLRTRTQLDHIAIELLLFFFRSVSSQLFCFTIRKLHTDNGDTPTTKCSTQLTVERSWAALLSFHALRENIPTNCACTMFVLLEQSHSRSLAYYTYAHAHTTQTEEISVSHTQTCATTGSERLEQWTRNRIDRTYVPYAHTDSSAHNIPSTTHSSQGWMIRCVYRNSVDRSLHQRRNIRTQYKCSGNCAGESARKCVSVYCVCDELRRKNWFPIVCRFSSANWILLSPFGSWEKWRHLSLSIEMILLKTV